MKTYTNMRDSWIDLNVIVWQRRTRRVQSPKDTTSSARRVGHEFQKKGRVEPAEMRERLAMISKYDCEGKIAENGGPNVQDLKCKA